MSAPFHHPTWSPAPERLCLAEGEVHLWEMPLDEEGQSFAALSAAEQERGQRFFRERDGLRFLRSRAGLRAILSRYAGVPAAVLSFVNGPHGKPALAAPLAWLHFNLSHSGGWMLLAVSHSREVGVDLEAMRGEVDFAGIAARVFSLEEAEGLDQLPLAEQPARFYELWTATEARLKARGLGLSAALPPDARAWPLRVRPGFAAALAVAGAPPELRCWTWPN